MLEKSQTSVWIVKKLAMSEWSLQPQVNYFRNSILLVLILYLTMMSILILQNNFIWSKSSLELIVWPRSQQYKYHTDFNKYPENLVKIGTNLLSFYFVIFVFSSAFQVWQTCPEEALHHVTSGHYCCPLGKIEFDSKISARLICVTFRYFTRPKLQSLKTMGDEEKKPDIKNIDACTTYSQQVRFLKFWSSQYLYMYDIMHCTIKQRLKDNRYCT